ncbi:hypothetical protein JXQ70_08045 [bacterium]|nr:hypothetical protein [bacterium]
MVVDCGVSGTGVKWRSGMTGTVLFFDKSAWWLGTNEFLILRDSRISIAYSAWSHIMLAEIFSFSDASVFRKSE